MPYVAALAGIISGRGLGCARPNRLNRPVKKSGVREARVYFK